VEGEERRLELLVGAAAGGLAVAAALLCLLGGKPGCQVATMLGSEGLYFILGIAAYALIDGRLGAVGVVGAAAAASATVLLKHLLGMPRPPGAASVGASGPGFPSGHTAVAAGFWLAMAFWLQGRVATVAAAALAAVVGYTRVSLGAHYVHDVVGGFAVGLFSAAIVAATARRQGVTGAALILAPMSFLSAFLAALLAPSYQSAWRLTGIDVGLYTAAAWLLREGIEWCLSAPLGLGWGFAAFTLPLAVLAATLAAEEAVGIAASLAGFALFAALALGSRPLVCVVRGAGSRGGPLRGA
jgi:membrane-associated phospholipid phosphatase